MPSNLGVQRLALGQGYENADGVIQFTNKWGDREVRTHRNEESPPTHNPKTIYLSAPKTTAEGAAHEFIHWMSHPRWWAFESMDDMN